MNRRDFLMIVLDVIIIAIAPATLICAVVQAQHPVGGCSIDYLLGQTGGRERV